MTPVPDRTLRGVAVAVFALQVALDVGYVVASAGLTGRPGLTYPYELHLGTVWGGIVPGAVGLALTWARPRNPVGWLIAVSGTCLGLSTFGQTYGARAIVVPEDHLPAGELVLSLSAPLWVPALFICVTHLLVRYPTGRVSGLWTHRFDLAALAGFALVYVGYATSIQSVTDVVVDGEPPLLLDTAISGTLLAVGAALVLASSLLIVADAVRRARQSPGPVRMALVWLLTTAVLAVVTLFFGPYEWTGELVYSTVMVAVAVGVVRYRALGIDVVLRRTLTYAVLTGLVLLVLTGVVAGLTRLVPTGPLPQLVAAVVVAVGLTPARDRLQRLIDRVLYGERDDPFAALRRLTTPMGSPGAPDPLPAILLALAEGLHVEGAGIVTTDGTAIGTVPDHPAEIPLSFGGAPLGTLLVGRRKGEAALSAADRRLLDAVAPLIATVLHAVRLADELRAEQARVVEATHEERGRLRRELHDGLGPSLTGIGLGLEALAPSVPSGRPGELAARLRHEVASALEETRRIIDDLRPAALDTEDLAAAIRRRTEQVGLTGLAVTFESPDRLPELPTHIATAAFRIADEALTNVVRHSRATTCGVRLCADGVLRVEVSDDGVGPGTGRDGGVGLDSMRERAERLGGSLAVLDTHPGTAVRAELPLEAQP